MDLNTFYLHYWSRKKYFYAISKWINIWKIYILKIWKKLYIEVEIHFRAMVTLARFLEMILHMNKITVFFFNYYNYRFIFIRILSNLS